MKQKWWIQSKNELFTFVESPAVDLTFSIFLFISWKKYSASSSLCVGLLMLYPFNLKLLVLF
jgi:hypothetical protein